MQIFEAIESGDPQRVVQMVREDAAVAGQRNAQGISALMVAIYGRQGEMVETLVDALPDLDFHQAVALGDAARVASHLEAGAGVDEFTPDGFAPLHLAAFFGHTEVAGLLLAQGAVVDVMATNGSALRPLNSAVAGGHAATVDLLLAHDAPVDSAQAGGFTALMSAAAGGHRAIAEKLLAAGADPTVAADDGRTAADLARERGHDDLAPLFET